MQGDLTASRVKKNFSYFSVPEEETWRFGPILELTADDLFIPGFTDEETSSLLETLCAS